MTATLTLPAWERRYRAPSVFLPDWSPDAPDRIVYVSNESGVWQVHCRDLATGASRQVTDHPVGVIDGRPTLDGTGVLWFSDASGDESGQWQVAPFEGGEPRRLLDGRAGWLERGPRRAVRHRRGRRERPRGLRDLRLGAGRARPARGHEPRVAPARRRGGRRFQPGRPVGRWLPHLHRGQRARRSPPSRPAGHRQRGAERWSGSCATRGWPSGPSPGHRSPARRSSRSSTSWTATSGPGSGIRGPARAGGCRSTCPARSSSSTGTRTARPCCSRACTTAATGSTGMTWRRGPRRRSSTRSGPSPGPPTSAPMARSGTGSRRATPSPGSWRTTAARSSRRPATGRPPAVRSSRGISPTSTARTSMGSTSSRRAAVRSRA